MTRTSPQPTIPAGPEQLTLAPLGEPVAIRARWRELAASDPDLARAEVTRLVTARLWRGWRPTLAAVGVRLACFRDALAGLDREMWLWAAGDRPWAQVAQSAIGRVERRCVRAGPSAPAAVRGG